MFLANELETWTAEATLLIDKFGNSETSFSMAILASFRFWVVDADLVGEE
jgi:hypothetical protein